MFHVEHLTYLSLASTITTHIKHQYHQQLDGFDVSKMINSEPYSPSSKLIKCQCFTPRLTLALFRLALYPIILGASKPSFFYYTKGILMDSPLEPSKFELDTEAGRTKYYMTAMAEFFACLSNLETSMPEITSIIHTIDLELSPQAQLKSIDNVLHKYILSWQTLHLYYQELLKMKDIESPRYYQDELYPR